MEYYAKITWRKGGAFYLVEFPGLSGCLTEGKNLEDALKRAKEALHRWLINRQNRELETPAPVVRMGKNYYAVGVDPNIATAIKISS